MFIADCGQELYVQVEYESFAPVDHPVIQVVFGNVMDYVFEVNTYITPKRLEKLEKTGKILFRIPELPITFGEYPLYVTIKDVVNPKTVNLVDEWTQAGLLNVTRKHKAGLDLSAGFYGRIISPYTWEDDNE